MGRKTCHRAHLIVGQRQHLVAPLGGQTGNLDRLRRVIVEGHHQQHVVRADRHDLFDPHRPDVVNQMCPLADVGQAIDHVSAKPEGTPRRRHMHRIAFGQQGDKAVQLPPVERQFDAQQGLHTGLHKTGKHMGRAVEISLGPGRFSHAVGIGQAGAQKPFAKHRLQFGKAYKAQFLGKAGDGGGRHLRLIGDAHQRVDRDLFGVVEEELCDLGQTFGQLARPQRKVGPQGFIVARGRGWVRPHRPPSVQNPLSPRSSGSRRSRAETPPAARIPPP